MIMNSGASHHLLLRRNVTLAEEDSAWAVTNALVAQAQPLPKGLAV
jgi:hypothetical protein